MRILCKPWCRLLFLVILNLATRDHLVFVQGFSPPCSSTITTTTKSTATLRLTHAFNNNNNNAAAKTLGDKTTTTTTMVALLLHAKKPINSELDESVQKKIVAETIAPWRSLRLFLYGVLGAGAGVSGLVTLSRVAAGLAGAQPDLDLNGEYVNLAVDFGGAIALAFLFKWDSDRQAELDKGVAEKMERRKEIQEASRGMKDRERALSNLLVNVQVSLDGDTKSARIGDLQAGAKQHLIIVAGPKKACKDALIGANLLKMDFAMSNVLVVPYDMESDSSELIPSTGFGERPVYERQPYIARVVGEGWKELIRGEMDDAVKQNGSTAKEDGIAIVVANNGKVIRRGVGKVPWRQMVEQLEEEVSGKKKEQSLF